MPIEPTKHLVKLEDPSASQAALYFSGALLASDIAIAVQLLQLPTLSPSLIVALWCVAISLPGLAFDFVLDLYTRDHGYVLEILGSLDYGVFYRIVASIAIIAVGAAIHHSSQLAAYAFGALSAFAYWRLLRYAAALEEEVRRRSTSAPSSRE